VARTPNLVFITPNLCGDGHDEHCAGHPTNEGSPSPSRSSSNAQPSCYDLNERLVVAVVAFLFLVLANLIKIGIRLGEI
jgi:hypothetical protein